MKIIDLKQDSPAWHAWRTNVIGASDAAVLVDASPYKTFWSLWAEKCNVVIPADLSKNPHVIRGKTFEDTARKEIESEFGKDPTPKQLKSISKEYEQVHSELLVPVCAQHDSYPYIGCSFDGLMRNGTPVEIKIPSDRVFEEVVSQQYSAKAVVFYSFQVQYQLLVSGAKKGFLVFYHLKSGQMQRFTIERDDKLLFRMKKRADELFAFIQSRTEPPKDSQRDPFFPKGDQAKIWSQRAARARYLKERIDKLQNEAKELQTEFDEAIAPCKIQLESQGFKFGQFAGLLLTKCERKGSVDYQRYFLDKHGAVPYLENFRKKSSEYWRATVDSHKLEMTDSAMDIDQSDAVDIKKSVGFF